MKDRDPLSEIHKDPSELSPEERLERFLITVLGAGDELRRELYATIEEATKAARDFVASYNSVLSFGKQAFPRISVRLSGPGIKVNDIRRDEDGKLTDEGSMVELDPNDTRHGLCTAVCAEPQLRDDGSYGVAPILVFQGELVEYSTYGALGVIVSHTELTPFIHVPCSSRVAAEIPLLERTRARIEAMGKLALHYSRRPSLNRSVNAVVTELEQALPNKFIPISDIRYLHTIGRAGKLKMTTEDSKAGRARMQSLKEAVSELFCQGNPLIIGGKMHTLSGEVLNDELVQGSVIKVIAGMSDASGGELVLVMEGKSLTNPNATIVERYHIPMTRITEFEF